MKVVWKAVHQNDRRLLTCILSGVNAVSVSLYQLFSEIHLLSKSNRMKIGSDEPQIDTDAMGIHRFNLRSSVASVSIRG
jgi:hypothetical protein